MGRSGCTRVHIESLDEETLGEALPVAWQNSMARGPAPSKAKTVAKRAASSATPAKRAAQRRSGEVPTGNEARAHVVSVAVP